MLVRILHPTTTTDLSRISSKMLFSALDVFVVKIESLHTPAPAVPVEGVGLARAYSRIVHRQQPMHASVHRNDIKAKRVLRSNSHIIMPPMTPSWVNKSFFMNWLSSSIVVSLFEAAMTSATRITKTNTAFTIRAIMVEGAENVDAGDCENYQSNE